MAIVTWGPELEIGVHEIDSQHRNFVAIANHLHDAIAANQAQEAIDWIIDELTLFAKFHFEAEEKLMARYKLANVEEHIREHKAMLKSISRFKKKLHAGEPRVDRDVMTFLGGWFMDHIKGTDQVLGQHIAAKGGR